MIWSDIGVVLSNRKHGEKYKIVNIFTRDHGKVAGLFTIIQRNTFSMFSTVSVDLNKKNENDQFGFWNKSFEKQNWIHLFKSQTHILVLQSICLILDKLLPYGATYLKIFDFISHIADSMHFFSSGDIVKIYTYFEFIVLKEIGFGFDLDVCSICGNVEPLFYLSPKTGMGASRDCAILYKDKLFEIPKIWKQWQTISNYEEITKIHISYFDLLKSLKITGYFIEKNAIPIDNHFRNSIIYDLENAHKKDLCA